MKVIVSHDIDHLTVSEHLFKDAIVPKYYIRSYIELLSGKISLAELFNRSLNDGYIPPSQKSAYVTPHLKKEDLMLMTDFRPSVQFISFIQVA